MTNSIPIDVEKLRQPGDARLLELQNRFHTSSPFMSPQATVQLLHDLQVHQIELELQNEELRNTQLQLDAERARYFDLYDLAPIGYCTLSEKGLLLEANLTAATLLGVARSALIGKAFSRFILREDQDIYYLHRKNLFDSGAKQSCELRMRSDAGESFWAQLEASIARNAEGEVLHRLMLTDISERKALDQALQEKNVELERARIVADKANRAKSDFLSSMSHELRSPLNSILGFAQLLDNGTPAPTSAQKARIDHILKAGWYLLDLINEILDLALIESGKLSFSLEALSLSEILSDCQNMIAPLAEQTGVLVSIAAFDSDCFVHADRTRVTQLIVNLLSNAVKYNRVNGTVTVSAQAIAPERLRISVRDTGQGLSESKLTQLFQPFNRLGQETSRIAGTGIGLTVCKRLIEMMGGAIGVESTVGVGSVFWIELNLAARVAHTVVADNMAQMLPPASARPDGRQRAVLYVEDNPANMELVAQIVASRSDLRLLGALNGTQGIALAKSELPDVILLDINLPDMSGLQVLQVLRRDLATQKIPVLALTANAMPHDIETGRAAGFLCYLTKPIKNKELLQALDQALEIVQTRETDAKNQKDFV